MFNLENKVVLITGAGGGIGAGLAAGFAAAGATVVLSGRDIQRLEKVAGDLRAPESTVLGEPRLPCLHIIPADLAKEGEAARLIDETVKTAGKIDILVNNAGITKDTLLMRMTDEQFDDVINTNLGATFQLTRAAIMPMMKQRFGRIINMTSIVGAIGSAGQANYAASKAGIIGLTKSVAAEVASRGITVNAIAPGFIETPMTDVIPAELKETYLKQIPAGRSGTPADVAAAAIFLASDEAAYITGQTIHVNGGMFRN